MVSMTNIYQKNIGNPVRECGQPTTGGANRRDRWRLLERPPNVPIAVDSWTIVEIRAAFTWKVSSEQSLVGQFLQDRDDVAIDSACTSCETKTRDLNYASFRGSRWHETRVKTGVCFDERSRLPTPDPSIEPVERSGQVRFINERTIDIHSDRVGSRRGRSAAWGQALERRVRRQRRRRRV